MHMGLEFRLGCLIVWVLGMVPATVTVGVWWGGCACDGQGVGCGCDGSRDALVGCLWCGVGDGFGSGGGSGLSG